ncbi:MAG: hypothetical protein HY264_10520 [Chloroflexi bacterium]|nr:hypothetical protein [Chloroflexota bacterium]
MGTTWAARDLVTVAMAVAILSAFVDGPAVWLLAGLLLAAVLLGTLQVLGEGVAAAAGPGVPVEALLIPSVTAVAILGSLRLVPIGVLLLPAILLGAWLLLRALGIEARVLASQTGPSGADRTAVVGTGLIVGFLAFLGSAALVPGSLPEPGVTTAGPTGAQLAALAGGDALIAFLLGYRVAALRTSNLRDVAWFALTCAIVVAMAALALRAMEIPRLLGPALLVLVFFLWDAIHGTAPVRRRDRRRLWETILLAILGLLVVVWSARLHP